MEDLNIDEKIIILLTYTLITYLAAFSNLDSVGSLFYVAYVVDRFPSARLSRINIAGPDLSPPSRADVRILWSFTSTPTQLFVMC
jgi:hypothetical protein